MKVTTMKIHNYSTRGAILLLIVSLLFSVFAAGQAMGADPRSPHAVASSQAPARLVIRRMPNLGNNVIVQLSIDGQPAGSISYGHTYEGSLPPGRHVLGVLATGSLSPIPWEMPLNVQSGHTYIFTAGGNGSGNVVLYSGGL
jgi:hypothetical protein